MVIFLNYVISRPFPSFISFFISGFKDIIFKNSMLLVSSDLSSSMPGNIIVN